MRPKRAVALQEVSPPQAMPSKGLTQDLKPFALQDDLSTEVLALYGLIATLTGFTLQEDIAIFLSTLILKASQIRANKPAQDQKGEVDANSQTGALPATLAPGATAI